MADVLQGIHFSCRVVKDGSRGDMLSAVRQLSRDISASRERQAVAVLHFSGHGASVGGENYLLPADFELEAGGRR